jgi:ABC-type phosphate transport system permease subunit
MNDSPKERIIYLLLAACAWSAVISLGVITVFIFQAGLPLIAKVGIPNFLFNAVWDPTAKTPSFGILSMLIGSIWLTFGALLVGVPLGLAVTVFMTDLAPPLLVSIMRPAVQLLAGIPSVIYGFVGLTTLAPLVRSVFGGPGLSVLTGALILGIMILPTVISISEDAVRAVPPALRQGALADARRRRPARRALGHRRLDHPGHGPRARRNDGRHHDDRQRAAHSWLVPRRRHHAHVEHRP